MMEIKKALRDHGLTLEEYDRIVELMGREPNYLELSLFGVMWSEHCCYKTSKKLLQTLPTEGSRVLQGPGENAGVIDLGDGIGLAFKMESHNHPSAIEPFQGAATGVGGIIRDIFAMGARPCANLNSIRFGDINHPRTKALLNGVVAGIGSYGNCMGIPTVAGETYFHPSYQGNPLVNAMCAGFIKTDRIFLGKALGVGNTVMLVGARTGRDGIKGASFASEELSEQDADKRHNVQVGDPFMEKLLMEATLEILEKELVVGLQDLGAAGLTSSGCEMAGKAGNGIYMDLDLVPLREKGLEDWEIMLSESQERMLLIVEPKKTEEIEKVFDKWDLLATPIGKVTDDGYFTLKRGDKVLASVKAEHLTSKAPVYDRPSAEPAYFKERRTADFSKLLNYPDYSELLLKLISSPNLSCKKWVYEQYDSTVMLNTVEGPGGDAALLRVEDLDKGISLCVDCNSRYVYLDPENGTSIAVAESALNVSCSGAKPIAITNCLNFGNPENPEIFWQFKKAIAGLKKACEVLETPVTGGNVSFYNEFDGKAVHPTPVIGMVGLVSRLYCRATHYFKRAGDEVFLIGSSLEELGASEAHYILTGRDEGKIPAIDLNLTKNICDLLPRLIMRRHVSSAHDVSDGGLLVALAECCFPRNLGLNAQIVDSISTAAAFFGESQNRVIVTVPKERAYKFVMFMKKLQKPIPFAKMGVVTAEPRFIVGHNEDKVNLPLAVLREAWEEKFAKDAKI
jgi:phosphoribosylformylglycinamidine synthase